MTPTLAEIMNAVDELEHAYRAYRTMCLKDRPLVCDRELLRMRRALAVLHAWINANTAKG